MTSICHYSILTSQCHASIHNTSTEIHKWPQGKLKESYSCHVMEDKALPCIQRITPTIQGFHFPSRYRCTSIFQRTAVTFCKLGIPFSYAILIQRPDAIPYHSHRGRLILVTIRFSPSWTPALPSSLAQLYRPLFLSLVSFHTGSFSQCALEAEPSQTELTLSCLEDVHHHLAFFSILRTFPHKLCSLKSSVNFIN